MSVRRVLALIALTIALLCFVTITQATETQMQTGTDASLESTVLSNSYLDAESESESEAEVDVDRSKAGVKLGKNTRAPTTALPSKPARGKRARSGKSRLSRRSRSRSGQRKSRRSGKSKSRRSGKSNSGRKRSHSQNDRVRSDRRSRCYGAGCRPRHGWGVSPRTPRRVQQRLPEPRLTGAASTLTRANVRCVLCQFVVQKIKQELTGDAQEAGSTALIEAFSFASAQDKSRIESQVDLAASVDAKNSAIPDLFDRSSDPARRFRHTDVLASRASRARFSTAREQLPSAASDAKRSAYLQLYASVYSSFEQLCTKHMPLAYLPYCNDMLKSYRFFAQGINYGDRPEQICMSGNFCDARAYVRRVTHNIYQREPGDA